MFANTQMRGIDFGFPDVCLAPGPAQVPIPYPNIAKGVMGVPAAYHVLFTGTPAHTMATVVPLSSGDATYRNRGVASGGVMGPSRPVTGALTVLVGGMPATRMTSMNLQNATNCPGMRIVPSQSKVLLLAR